ncbi:MAG TPA: branched-chain amino acid ABC transporter permease [Beijerinckiaceae bacterium]|jgi:branched-chain amino acid transport system permease protein
MNAIDKSVVAPAQSASARLLAGARWRWYEVLFWALAVASFFVFPSKLMLISEIFILGLLALSIDLTLGFAGLVTLGQGAFFGIGAYAAGLMAKHGAGVAPMSDPLVGLVVAALAAGVVGLATSFLVLRGSDLTRLMVTLGVALIVEELVNQLKDITGGTDGLQGVMSSPLFGVWSFDLFGRTAFWYALVVTFLCFWFARRLVNSPYGLSLLAIKGNPLRARAIGMPVNARLVVIYTVAATIAGIAGGLLTQTTQFASPDMVAFHRSADSLLILIFGGAGYLYGGLIGAVAFRVMQDYLGNITPQYWLFWVGAVLVLLVLFVRNGIIGLMIQGWNKATGAGREGGRP